MKKIWILSFIILIVIAVYLTTQSAHEVDSDELPVRSKPSVVSRTDQTQHVEFDQAEWESKNQIEMDRREFIWLAYLAGRDPHNIKSEPTYLEAYRDYKYYENCILLIGNIISEVDPIAAVLNVRPDRLDEVYEQLPDAQKSMISRRINKCVSLTQFDAKVYYPERVRNELKIRMDSITPKSSNEIELAVVLQSIELFESAHGRVQSLKNGENIDQQLFFDLWQQRKDIQVQFPNRLSLFGGFSSSDQPLVEQLNQQMEAIDQQIEANKSYDHEAIKSKQQEISLFKETIVDQLINVTSSDAYLAIQELLTNSRFEGSLDSVLIPLQAKQMLTPKKYGQFIVPIVTHLRACELGHPCGPDSAMAEQKCLDFSDQNAANACQLGILDYYLEHHLSPHQLTDVELLLESWY